MKRVIVAVVAIGLGAMAVLGASGSKKQASISREKAEKIALERAPGKVREAELETENKILVWSFDIDTASGIKEVQVNAHTGAIVSVEDESEEDEANEAKKDAEDDPH